MTHAATSDAFRQDAIFFRNLVTIMAAILVAGFVFQLAMGRSSFDAPTIVHLHGVAFMGWIGIVVAQVWLASTGSFAHHRTLGWIAVAYALALVILGPMVTLAAAQTGRVPFFFQPQHFLIANPATMVMFAGCLAAAIMLRKRPDWHARLQIAAFVSLTGPGFGRLLPMPLLSPYAFEAAGLAALVYPAIGIVRDIRVHGRAHPAWFWCIGALIAVMALSRAAAFTALGDELYAAATAGTAMEGTDGRAFPPMPAAPEAAGPEAAGPEAPPNAE